MNEGRNTANMVGVLAAVEHGGAHLFKKFFMLRPFVGEMIVEGKANELRWRVKSVSLLADFGYLSVHLEPGDDDTAQAIVDPKGKLLRAAGWETFRPRIEDN